MPRRDHVNPETRYNKDRAPRIPDVWAAWLTLHDRQFIRVISRMDQSSPEAIGVAIQGNTRFKGGTFHLPLTGMTEPELDALQLFINETIDLARPVCKLRDEVSAAREAAGDDSDYRIYRRLPELVVRAWARLLDPESLFSRLADLPDADAADVGAAGDAGVAHGGMAELDPTASAGVDKDD